jgi:hypothetical protein
MVEGVEKASFVVRHHKNSSLASEPACMQRIEQVEAIPAWACGIDARQTEIKDDYFRHSYGDQPAQCLLAVPRAINFESGDGQSDTIGLT